MNIDNRIYEMISKEETSLGEIFKKIDEVCFFNQIKVINAMQDNNLSERHFNVSTGYGYNDDGRDCCEAIFAQVFGAQKALVRPQIVSGTHAITLALFGLLRPGDELLSVTAEPYDTILSTIGISRHNEKDCGSLKDFGISYKQIEFTKAGRVDLEKITNSISDKTKVVYIQRSTGYSNRTAVDIKTIKEVIEKVRTAKNKVNIVVDNCYGEFLEKEEPTEVGADVIVGSMIKNPGGGLAQTGGYIAGKEECIDKIASRLSAPGIAYEVGSNLGVIRSYLQGLFLAPRVTANAIKGAVLSAKVFSSLGYEVFPKYDEKRSDIVQAIVLKSKEKADAFCKGIQQASPVDSYVTPVAWDMPGYDDQVIMAAGNFIQGSSIELSADGPMREPYTVYQQGGLTYEHAKLGIMSALCELMKISNKAD